MSGWHVAGAAIVAVVAFLLGHRVGLAAHSQQLCSGVQIDAPVARQQAALIKGAAAAAVVASVEAGRIDEAEARRLLRIPNHVAWLETKRQVFAAADHLRAGRQ